MFDVRRFKKMFMLLYKTLSTCRIQKGVSSKPWHLLLLLLELHLSLAKLFLFHVKLAPIFLDEILIAASPRECD